MNPLSRRRFTLMALGAPLALLGPPQASANLIETIISRAHVPRHDDEVWVMVDDREATLTVYRGNLALERFAPISLGRSGARATRRQGSNVRSEEHTSELQSRPH